MGRRIVTFALALMLAAGVASALWSVRSASADPLNPVAPNGEIVPVQNTTPPSSPRNSTVPQIDPVPGAPGGPVPIQVPLAETPTVPIPPVRTQQVWIGNRTSSPTYAKHQAMPNGDQVSLITGGVKILARFDDRNKMVVDIEADQVVIWQKGGQSSDLLPAMTSTEGATTTDQRQIELYLSGNVVIRYGQGTPTPQQAAEDKIMRAERAYYDVTHNRAVGFNADLEFIRASLPVPAHVKAETIYQVSEHEFVIRRAEMSASKLPADPGLDLTTRDVTITEEKDLPARTIFGFPIIDRETGKEDVGTYRYFKANNTFLDFGGVPVFWFPYLSGDVSDPMGPLQNISFGENRIFGYQLYTTWSILELIGVKKLPNERFNLELDYLSQRGPGIGLNYDLMGPKLFGYDAPFITHFLAYTIQDKGIDQLGGPRDLNWVPPGERGRAFWRHIQEYDNFTFQGQVAYLSDPNFLEAYYKQEFDMGPNQETFGYLKYQTGIGAASIWAEPNLSRPWVTETQWLPRVDGWWLGQSLFDRITYSTWAGAGYANLQVYRLPPAQLPPNVNPLTVPTETPVNTGRIDWMQQFSLPFTLGFLKLVPFGNVDLAYYSQDNFGDERERAYGGVGLQASMSLSRLYPDVTSELFNVQGIFHKINFNANYYNAWTNTPSALLPQLDRMNDDATQQSNLDIKPWDTVYYPGATGESLFLNPLYDPRLYAIRRLDLSSPDNLDNIQVLQADIYQRWQTKRGYPGMEHTVDYVTLDLSASFFPQSNRDNFGHSVSFLEYAATWAAGDRTGLTSSGWVDPYSFGTRYYNVTGYFNRPDGTNVSLSYRNFEPVGSHLVSGTVSYQFSPKYAFSFTAAYDFGISNNESTSLVLTRVGTDLTWNFGFTYNAILNNFGVTFMVLPNLMTMRPGASGFMNSATGNLLSRQ